MQNQVDLTLMEFVEKQILPRYTAFGESHGLYHVTRVIKNSLELARMLGADINMAYAIAAYHDLGMEGPRAIHHITSGKILTADARLKKWFTPEQIKIMREAVEDHRASASHAPRSIYGKIVAEADRDIDIDTVFTRAIQYVSSMILTKTRSGNSSASIATWRKNTPIMATSNYGFPTLLTRKN